MFPTSQNEADLDQAIDMKLHPLWREKRLWWYGHVIYVDDNSLTKMALNIQVDRE